MPGINTTGLPNTDDYNLGRGIVYFAPLASDGTPLEYRDLGNAPEFNISVESETLEHQSSRGGLKKTDKEVLISQKISVTLTLDEINFGNLAIFLSGETDSTYVNPELTAESNLGPIVLGRWYDIVDINGDRMYDLQSDATFTVKSNITALVIDDDFTMDYEYGRIFIVSTGAAVAGEALNFELTNSGAGTPKTPLDEVRGLTQTAITGALKFISENPAADDNKTEFQFHQVELKPEGDFSLIGDDWSTMQFTAAAEVNSGEGLQDKADDPVLTIRTVDSAA